MSNEDDRTRQARGYSDSRYSDPGYSDPGYSDSGYSDRGYSDSGRSDSPYPGSGDYSGYGATTTSKSDSFPDDDDYTSGPTSVLPGSQSDYDPDYGLDGYDEPDRRKNRWHAGADLGLLVLRVVVGGLFVAHAVQKLFGWLAGPGLAGTEQMLADFGYTEPTVLAWVTGMSELVGGALLVLGLLTPVGAAAILGVMANAIVVKLDTAVFAGGVELEVVYAAAAFALLFAGPGRVSLDRPTHWYRWAPAYGTVFLLLSAAATVVTLVVFR